MLAAKLVNGEIPYDDTPTVVPVAKSLESLLLKLINRRSGSLFIPELKRPYNRAYGRNASIYFPVALVANGVEAYVTGGPKDVGYVALVIKNFLCNNAVGLETNYFGIRVPFVK